MQKQVIINYRWLHFYENHAFEKYLDEIGIEYKRINLNTFEMEISENDFNLLRLLDKYQIFPDTTVSRDLEPKTAYHFDYLIELKPEDKEW